VKTKTAHCCRWIVAVLWSLLAATAYAQSYEVNVNPQLNGLDIKIEPLDSPGLLVLKLTNNTPTKVRCEMRYNAPPQPLYRTTTFVDAGETAQSTLKAKRKWHKVDVDVTCTPIENK
jgi:hypothetical protein